MMQYTYNIYRKNHAVTVVITYFVLLIKALQAIATLTFWSSLVCHLSFFICYCPCFFVSWVIYIIKFILEINTEQLAHK